MTATNFSWYRPQQGIHQGSERRTDRTTTRSCACHLYAIHRKGRKALVTVLNIGATASVLLVLITTLYLVLKGPANGQKTLTIIATGTTAIYSAFSFGRFASSPSEYVIQYLILVMAVIMGALVIHFRQNKTNKSKVGASFVSAASKAKPATHNARAGRLAPPAQLTRIESDAAVGLHVKYDSRDSPTILG